MMCNTKYRTVVRRFELNNNYDFRDTLPSSVTLLLKKFIEIIVDDKWVRVRRKSISAAISVALTLIIGREERITVDKIIY